MARSLIATVLLLTASSIAATVPPGYDTLGPIASPPLKSDQLLRRVRSFIVKHWEQHRRGYIVYTMHLPNEAPFTGTFYIEPAADGIWHIRGATRVVSSGRLIHSLDATSFNRYGPYLYFHDKSDKLVGAL